MLRDVRRLLGFVGKIAPDCRELWHRMSGVGLRNLSVWHEMLNVLHEFLGVWHDLLGVWQCWVFGVGPPDGAILVENYQNGSKQPNQHVKRLFKAS